MKEFGRFGVPRAAWRRQQRAKPWGANPLQCLACVPRNTSLPLLRGAVVCTMEPATAGLWIPWLEAHLCFFHRPLDPSGLPGDAGGADRAAHGQWCRPGTRRDKEAAEKDFWEASCVWA